MIVSLMAAMSENRVIGIKNALPWNLPEDLKRLKNLTTGHPVVMGRKTFESIGKPLPKRKNYVVTRDKSLSIPGAVVVNSVSEALKDFQKTDEEVFILGGGEIFSQTIAEADRIYLTVVHKNFEGDAHFPEIPKNTFKLIKEEKHGGDLPFSFLDYSRI